ncbi:unnamed protein product [Phyllotreta striolata]|uniref:AB hydrolase-1 domain-containing protein n=1 Tax=Phyllotreta striolata TaxID=444603 RepID=A0A9N9TXH2_PHYSR|nr:unnamed protein product [Phyllotreta striolata]
MAATNRKIGEIRIPVPWGHVAAKTWGEPDDQLVLCVHGVMDNAGTFDRLIERLPSSFYYVCIDLPGHGKSTHFPPHLPIHTTDYLLVYREVTRHFDDRKFVLIGHSYGGQIGFMYAQIYPNHVKSLIMLDTLTSYPVPTDYFDVYMAERIEDHLRIANNLRSNRPPLYTREEALEKLITGRRSLKPMPTESAEALLTRAIEPAGDLYKFTTDQRLKNFINPLRDYSIDLPGHGRSSHFPPHLPVHTFNYIFVYKIIHRHFGRKLTILGHSYGGQIGFLFAQLYPECVAKLAMFDTISLFPVSTRNFKSAVRRAVEAHLELERKLAEGRRPAYTLEEALEKTWRGRSYAPISKEAAEALVERAVEPAGDGLYRFTLDQRVKNVINPLRDVRNILTVMKLNPVTCPVLIVLGTESTAQQILFSPLIQELKKRRNVRIKFAEGNHDVHNDKPELVAPHVLKFLALQSNKL